jgi:hypothetical protein
MNKIDMQFWYADTRRYQAEADPPKLGCHWLPPKATAWVNRLLAKCFFILTERHEDYIKTVTIKHDEIKRAILCSQDNIEMLYNKRCRSVLMGPRQIGQLAHECAPMCFEFTVDLGGPRGRRIFDIPIEIVPWMDGVLLLPEQL